MVFPDRPLDEFRHRVFVVREDLRHHVEEIVVIFVQNDSLEGDLRKMRFQTLRELALDFPILCWDS